MRRSNADALARLLDGDEPHGPVSEETRALATLGTAMRSSAALPRPEFKADLRAALLAEAQTIQAERLANPSLLTRLRNGVSDTAERWRYSTRMAAASASAAMALSGGGVAYASSQAEPGDLLYPVKLTLEEARLSFVQGEADKGAALLDRSLARVSEAGDAVHAGKDPTAAAQALAEADESARRGAGILLGLYQRDGNAEALALLADFSGEQRALLAQFAPDLRGEALVAAGDLLVVLDRIEARLAALGGDCPDCAEGMPAGAEGFDFSVIPPASERFDPCPCAPGASEGTDSPLAPADGNLGIDGPAGVGSGSGSSEGSSSGGTQRPSIRGGDSGSTAVPSPKLPQVEAGGDDGVRIDSGSATKPVGDAVDTTSDVVDKVIEDTTKTLQSPAPSTDGSLSGSSLDSTTDSVDDVTDTTSKLLP